MGADFVGRTWFTAERRALLGLLVIAVLVRGGVLWVMRGNLRQDPDAYREIAENLLRHGEFAMGKPMEAGTGETVTPTAYRPPLYPVVLSNLPAVDGQRVSLIKVAILHVLLGMATVWLTWATARRVGSAHRSESMVGIAHPTIAGLLVACDPILLNQQTLIMTETLAAFLAILSLWCLARFDAARSWFNAALAGGAIGLAVLCRPTFLPWLGLVAIAMLLVRSGRDFKFQISNFKFGNVVWRLANVVGLFVTAAAVISPWAMRNYRVFGKPIVTTTHGGYTLLLGNNASFYDWVDGKNKQDLPWTPPEITTVEDAHNTPLALLSSGPHSSPSWHSVLSPDELIAVELGYDALTYREGLNAIRYWPASFARASMYRVGQLWSPLPHKLTADESMSRRVLRYATCAWYCGVYALAAVGVWRLSTAAGTARPTALLAPPWVWGVLLCFAFTAVHTFYWTNLRMRAPLMPFVAIVAGAATISSRFKVQGSKSTKQEAGDGTRSVPAT